MEQFLNILTTTNTKLRISRNHILYQKQTLIKLNPTHIVFKDFIPLKSGKADPFPLRSEILLKIIKKGGKFKYQLNKLIKD